MRGFSVNDLSFTVAADSAASRATNIVLIPSEDHEN